MVYRYPAFDLLENLEFPSRNPGSLKFLPGFQENPGFPGRNPSFLSFLVGLLDLKFEGESLGKQIVKIILTFFEAIFNARNSHHGINEQKSVHSGEKKWKVKIAFKFQRSLTICDCDVVPSSDSLRLLSLQVIETGVI